MPIGDFIQPQPPTEVTIQVIQEKEDFFRASFHGDHFSPFFSSTGRTKEDAIGKLIISNGNRKNVHVKTILI